MKTSLLKINAPDLSKYKGFVFDMDGTITETIPLHNEYFIEILKHVGGKPDDFQKVYYDVGKAMDISNAENHDMHKRAGGMIRELMKMYGIEPPSNEEILRLRSEFGARALSKSVWKPYAYEFLKNLKDNGKPIALYTLTARDFVEKFINTAEGIKSEGDLLEIFGDNVLTGDSVRYEKPNPEGYLLAAEKLGLKPSECLAFEDTYKGAKAAIDAGMDVCIMRDEMAIGHHNYIAELPHFYIETFKTLL